MLSCFAFKVVFFKIKLPYLIYDKIKSDKNSKIRKIHFETRARYTPP